MTKADPATLKQWWLNYRNAQDPHAREQLITHYLYLVKYAVGRMLVHLPSHLEADDLTGYGLMGLIQAVEKFELARNIRFETFAMQRIRGAILDQLRALDWLPRSLRLNNVPVTTPLRPILQQPLRLIQTPYNSGCLKPPS